MSERNLVVIDVQRGFLAGQPFENNLPRNIADAATRYGALLVVTSTNPADGPWRRLLDWDGLARAEERANPPEFETLAPHFTITKSGYAATPHLGPFLQAWATTGVDLCGLDTDACVLATAFGLFDAGIDFRVRLDLCASTGGHEAHEAAAALMRRQFGTDRVITGWPGGEPLDTLSLAQQ